MNLNDNKNKKEGNRISLIDLLYLIVKWRKFMLINFFIVCVTIAIYSLIMPKTYTATAVIMPPQSNEVGGLAGILQDLPFAASGFGVQMAAPVTNYLAILNSRTVKESVINEFAFKNRFEVENNEQALLILEDAIRFEIREDGLISLDVNMSTGYISNDVEIDSTSQLASNIANFFISELDRVNKNFSTTKARYHRIFIERRFNQSKSDLSKAEKQLQEFQEKNNVIALPEQLQAAIETAADINANIVIAEVEMAVLENTYNSEHPKLQSLKAKISEFKSILSELQNGESLNKEELKLFPAFTEAPELGKRFVQMTRELEMQNRIYLYLVQEYEQSKLQEAKDTPTVQVLDSAVPTVIRSKPKRAMMVLLGGIAGILFSFITIIFIEYVRKLEKDDPQVFEKYMYILNNLKNDFNFFRKTE